jgi:hypothetical protein
MAIKKTVLEMTQKILSSMDSDEVNSINDTVEALQVAEIIEEVYENMIVEIDLPTHNILTKLTALADTDTPTHMRIPDDIGVIKWIKYDKQTDTDTDIQLKEITYLEPDEFHFFVARRNESNTNIQQVTDFGGTDLLIQNDKAPTYWTSFDDEYVVFDSFDSDLEATVQQSKTSVWGTKLKTFTLTDTFTPDLPDKFFPLLQAEAKAQAFAELKQVSNNKAERTSRKQRVKLQKDKQRTGADHAYNTYGRP